MAADGFKARKEALRLLGGFEALPRAFAATSGPIMTGAKKNRSATNEPAEPSASDAAFA